MGRPQKTTPARRYHLTVEADVADRIDAYAASVRRRPATVAARLLTTALQRAERGEADEEKQLAGAHQQIEELRQRVAHLRTQLSERVATPTELTLRRQSGQSIQGEAASPSDSRDVNGNRGQDRSEPRWEWTLEDLLTDDEWWERWLPRLYELLGTNLRTEGDGWAFSGEGSEPVLDSRGYSDLMSYLFPPGRHDDRDVTWRSTDYPHATAARQRQQHRAPTSVGPDAWEPVVRHVAEALCALESSGTEGADPYVRLRAKAEIIGPWAVALRYLVGDEAPTLPHRSGHRAQLAGTAHNRR